MSQNITCILLIFVIILFKLFQFPCLVFRCLFQKRICCIYYLYLLHLCKKLWKFPSISVVKHYAFKSRSVHFNKKIAMFWKILSESAEIIILSAF